MAKPIRPPAYLALAGVLALLVSVVPDVALAGRSVRCLGHPASIVGTSGRDVITATPDRDVIVSLGGNDRISNIGREHNFRTGNDLVCSGSGSDTVVGVSGKVFAGDGRDDVRTDGGVVRGGAGDDVLHLGSGLASGGPGNDRVKSDYGTAEGGEGADRLVGGEEIDGGPGDDLMLATPGCGPGILAGPGNDVMVGGRGSCLYDEVFSSFLYLTSAPRGISVDLERGRVRGWGKDSISDIHFVIGSRHDDVLVGSARSELLEGAGGDDRIFGRGGGDSLTGDDYYSPGQGGMGVAGSDLMRGGGGPDGLFGAEGPDRLFGGPGEDRVAGAQGRDALFGGPGSGDEVDYNRYVGDLDSGVTVDLRSGRARGAMGKDTLSGFESVHGTSLGDVLLGDAGTNRFEAGFGNDVVRGRTGDDLILDSLYWSGSGDDVYVGGPGSDTVSWSGADETISVDLAAGTASGNGSDLVNGSEIIIGSSNDDRLLGDARDNELRGGSGDDYLDGREGRDRLQGEEGADVCLNGEEVGGCP